MITNYFTSISSQKRKNEDVIEISEVPASIKKNKKRTSLNGFSNKNNPKRFDNFRKNPPSGDWRKIGKIKINYSYLIKKWTYKNNDYNETYLIPFGMLKTLERLHSHKKNYHSFKILSETVKKELGITLENYKKKILV